MPSFGAQCVEMFSRRGTPVKKTLKKLFYLICRHLVVLVLFETELHWHIEEWQIDRARKRWMRSGKKPRPPRNGDYEAYDAALRANFLWLFIWAGNFANISVSLEDWSQVPAASRSKDCDRGKKAVRRFRRGCPAPRVASRVSWKFGDPASEVVL